MWEGATAYMDSDYLSFDGLSGPRFELTSIDERYPDALRTITRPPETLYVIGNTDALQEGLAIVGARKATPYGKGCAHRFALRAAERGIVIISGGAKGCDSEAHKAALEANAPTVVFLGGGCDVIYPKENASLFQAVIDAGGAIVSEQHWTKPPLGYMFRERNRLIAGLAKATLIVQAALPSGTFSTADEALNANKEVWVVPGSIDSPQSRGANRLIYQGATPIVDDDSFDDQLFSVFDLLKQERVAKDDSLSSFLSKKEQVIYEGIQSKPMTREEIHELAKQVFGSSWTPSNTSSCIAKMETCSLIAKSFGGTYEAKVKGG